MSKSAQKTHAWQLPNREGLRTVHLTFCACHCIIFCIGSQPPNFCGHVGNFRNHKFHGVLYISYNFHHTFIFSDMAQYPSPWDGGCQAFNFCGGLTISCNSQQKGFSFMNWAQTPCGGGGIENMSFIFYWIPIMNVFHELAPEPPTLVSWGDVTKHELCAVLDISHYF